VIAPAFRDDRRKAGRILFASDVYPYIRVRSGWGSDRLV